MVSTIVYKSHTFGQVFALLDPERLKAGFARWEQTLHDQLTGRVVALDGKIARRAYDRCQGRSALPTVSAYAGESRLGLAQTAVAARPHEITAIPEVLALLDLAEATVTLDALGCPAHPVAAGRPCADRQGEPADAASRPGGDLNRGAHGTV